MMTRNLKGILLIASMLVVLWTTSSEACHRRRACQPNPCYYQSGCTYGSPAGYYSSGQGGGTTGYPGGYGQPGYGYGRPGYNPGGIGGFGPGR
jgi:hypothetical protein